MYSYSLQIDLDHLTKELFCPEFQSIFADTAHIELGLAEVLSMSSVFKILKYAGLTQAVLFVSVMCISCNGQCI
jgi:hypothetical protein